MLDRWFSSSMTNPLLSTCFRRLSKTGYTVRTAIDGLQALEELEQGGPEGIGGLITDVRLGEVDGWAVATRARELNPAVAVVYISGDSSHDWTSRGVPKSAVVQKPFAVTQLLVAITELINAS